MQHVGHAVCIMRDMQHGVSAGLPPEFCRDQFKQLVLLHCNSASCYRNDQNKSISWGKPSQALKSKCDID